MPTRDLPRLLKDLPRAPGSIKADYEDFVVEEIPLYPADGAGSHTYFLVEKAGLGTPQAINNIAHALNVRRHDIGFAGQKDSRAITRQWMSVEHVEPERVMLLDIPRIKILKTTRHKNKLRLGHLKGNNFTIRVRGTQPDRLAEFQDGLRELAQRGVPNYFGQQRFGDRGDNYRIGRAMLNEDFDEAVDLILGRPNEVDHGKVRQARESYERGEYVEAAKLWPAMYSDERRALKALAKTGGKRKRAFMAIDRNTRQFYISAFQSYVFNRVVAARLETGLDELWQGDLAWVHRNGAVFKVEDLAAEQPRATAFEISPSGPLFGARMSTPEGRADELETTILTEEGISLAAFRSGPTRVTGGRRPMRFQPTDANVRLGADARGPYLEFAFALPRGCYATALLREFFEETIEGPTAQ